MAGSDAAGSSIVNRYPAAGYLWSGAKSPIDGNAICALEKGTTDAKRLSFMS